MPNKNDLRKIFRAKRQALSASDLLHSSTKILNLVVSHNLVPKGMLMLYLDSAKHHELPMSKWFDKFDELPICVPKVIDDNGLMNAVIWEKDMPFETNKWGIKEPKKNVFLDPKGITAIIVPLLCFDNNGNRVGYGKGYYDRFIKKCSTHVTTIGVSSFDPIEKIDLLETTDIPLDYVVTPQKVYSFKN